MFPLAERISGYSSLFVQMAGVLLVLVMWALVRANARRPAFDAWWAGLGFLALGLSSYGLGVIVTGASDGDLVRGPYCALYFSLEYVSAYFFYRGARWLSGRPPLRYAPILVGLAAALFTAMTLAGVPFLRMFGIHSALLSTAYFACSVSLIPALRTLGGAGLRIVAWGFVVLGLTFVVHVPTLLWSELHLAGGAEPFGAAFVAINTYATMLAEIVLGIGMLVAEIDRVQDDLQRANAQLVVAQGQLSELATTDTLTGLRNRAALETAQAAGRFTSGHVVCLDLDGLKIVNDTYGHPCGDRAIRTFAHALRACAEHRDAAFRTGGDEFLVVYREDDEATIAARMRALQRDLVLTLDDGTTLPLLASFGIAPFASADDLPNAIALADARLYSHKARVR